MSSILCALAFSLSLASSTDSSTVTLDLNAAPVAALVQLPGIGKKRAQAIVARRERRPFRRLEELRQIRGIGPKLLARLRRRLRIGPPTPARPRSSPESARPRG